MIGIIGAMKMETEALVAQLEKPVLRSISGIEYYSGLLNGREVVIATCGVGKVAAAMCAQTMILCYQPELLLNTGIAGALSASLHTGDVVVSSALVEHDMDTTGLGDPIGLISGLGVVEMPADPDAATLMLDCCREAGVRAVSGLIATGDQFVCTAAARERILSRFSALACEMEGGAIAQICCHNQVPFVVIRAISAGADEGAGMDYPTFAGMAAANSVRVVSLFISRSFR